MTDRSLHLAWAGPAVAIGALLATCLRRVTTRAGRALLGAAVLALAVVAGQAVRSRIRVWSDPRALWTEAVTRAPGSARAWNNLGLVLLKQIRAPQPPRSAAPSLCRRPIHGWCPPSS